MLHIVLVHMISNHVISFLVIARVSRSKPSSAISGGEILCYAQDDIL